MELVPDAEAAEFLSRLVVLFARAGKSPALSSAAARRARARAKARTAADGRGRPSAAGSSSGGGLTARPPGGGCCSIQTKPSCPWVWKPGPKIDEPRWRGNSSNARARQLCARERPLGGGARPDHLAGGGAPCPERKLKSTSTCLFGKFPPPGCRISRHVVRKAVESQCRRGTLP